MAQRWELPQKVHRRLRRGILAWTIAVSFGRGGPPESPFIKGKAAGREAREPTAGGE